MEGSADGGSSRWRVSLGLHMTEPSKNLTKTWVMLDLRMQLYFCQTDTRTEGSTRAMKLMKIYCGSGKLRYGGRVVQYFRTERLA